MKGHGARRKEWNASALRREAQVNDIDMAFPSSGTCELAHASQSLLLP